MELSKYDNGLVVVFGIRPLELELYDLMPKGGFVIDKSEKLGLRLGFNNGFFTYTNIKGYVPEGRVIYKGKLVVSKPLQKTWAYTIFIFTNGGMRLERFTLASIKEIRNIHISIEAGPRLVYAGNIVNGLNKRIRGSRIAIGWDKIGRLCVAAIREKITLNDFAKLLESIGFLYALNLDGGGSTSLYYSEGGKRIKIIGVPTHPYDVIKFEHGAQGRKVPYMLGIK